MKKKASLIILSTRILIATALGGAGVLTGLIPVGAGEISPVESLDTGSLGAAVSARTLDHARGGFMQNDASLSGVMSNNSVTFGQGSNVSFSNVLGGNAFQNASGVVNVIQNNGNNVLIQNMVQLNLQFRK
jgi:hypothetical protein